MIKIITIFARQMIRTGHKLILLLAIFLLAIIQLSNFYTNFRISGDDIYFHYVGLSRDFNGWIDFAVENATYQGRIGHLTGVFLFLLGSYLADFPIAKVVYLVIFALYGITASLWIKKFSGNKLAILSIILFFSFTPLGNVHWVPNAYPLYIVPLIVLFFINIIKDKITNIILKLFLYILWILSIITLEYTLLLAPLMLLLEHWKNLNVFKNKFLLRDLIIVSISWFLFITFRIIFPSKYDGNTLSLESITFPILLKIQYLHTYGGLSFQYLKKHFSYRRLFNVVHIFVFNNIYSEFYSAKKI